MVFILSPKVGGGAEDLVVQNHQWRPIAETLSAVGAPLERLAGRLDFHGCGSEVTAEESVEIARFLEGLSPTRTGATDTALAGDGTADKFMRDLAGFARASGGFEVF